MKEIRVNIGDMKIEYTLPKVTVSPELEELFRKSFAEHEAKMWEHMTSPRQTALRWTEGRGLEVIYLDEPEPLRCTCAGWAIFHRSGCPLSALTT